VGLTEKAVCAATELLPIRRVKFGISVVPTSELPLSNWKTEPGKHLLHLEQGGFIYGVPRFPIPRLRLDGLSMVTLVLNESAS